MFREAGDKYRVYSKKAQLGNGGGEPGGGLEGGKADGGRGVGGKRINVFSKRGLPLALLLPQLTRLDVIVPRPGLPVRTQKPSAAASGIVGRGVPCLPPRDAPLPDSRLCRGDFAQPGATRAA